MRAAVLLVLVSACIDHRFTGDLRGNDPGGRPPIVTDPVYDACPDGEHALEAPVLVDDARNAIARDPNLTGFLVPFARDAALLSLNSLVVYGETGERLPAQFETLSRWGSSPDDC